MAGKNENEARNKHSQWRVSTGALNLIILSYGSQFIAHFNHLPIWLLVFMPAISLLAFASHREYLPHASPAVKRLLTLLFVVVFFAYYRINFNIEMAVAFLLLSTGLKLLELKTKRDCFLFIFATLYLMTSALLFSQAFLTTVYQFVSVVIAMLALLMLHSSWKQVNQMALFGSLFKWLSLAIPLILVLFLFFPRIAPLWSIPVSTGGALTGISDRMSPGDIAKLSNSSERAFRAIFRGNLPDRSQWYWRGVTLDLFDSRQWEASEILKNAVGKKIDTGRIIETTPNSYRILLEPTQQRWGFALAGSTVQTTNVYMNESGMVRFGTDVIQPTTYQMNLEVSEAPQRIGAYPIYVMDLPTTNPINRKDLQVPFRGNPETKNFAKALAQRYPTQLAYLQAVLDLFTSDSYFYTLEPPKTGDDFVDDFLFRTQRGFCAHYASSTAYLLRLAGIPARVVLGYLGGEYIQDQDYVLVHQYDAHGWVEAYLSEYGWVRIDPTAMVAPSRVEGGLREAVSEEGTFLASSPFADAVRSISALNWIRLEMEKLNYQWQKWVVGFDGGVQQGLFDDLLGGFSLTKVSYALALTFALMSGLVLVFLLRDQQEKKLSKAVKAYSRWLNKMAKLGFTRNVGETPRQFLARLKFDSEAERNKAENVTLAFEQLEYKRYPDAQNKKILAALRQSS